MSERLARCPWCGIPLVEHLVAAVEPATDDRPAREVFVCKDAPPFAKPRLVEPADPG